LSSLTRCADPADPAVDAPPPPPPPPLAYALHHIGGSNEFLRFYIAGDDQHEVAMFRAEVEKIAPRSVLTLEPPAVHFLLKALEETKLPPVPFGGQVPHTRRFSRASDAGAVAMFLDWFALSECRVILQVCCAMPHRCA
jgi:hypothetical protein